MLTIERPFLNQILEHLQNCYPREGCGLVAGNEMGQVTNVYPIDNILQSPTAFQMEPRQQIKAILNLEEQGWQMAAIYHSHPLGPEQPSISDIQQAHYPETLTMIVSLKNRDEPTIRVFQIEEQTVTEKKMRVVQPTDKNCV